MKESKWRRAEHTLGATLTDSLKALYDFYGTETVSYLARLYEPEIGGFYYADSARDTVGFLPDIESTTQALEILSDGGIAGDCQTDIATVLPEGIKQSILRFAKELQDPEDGYFYHPQWGKSIGSSRKGRDLNSSLWVIRRMGGTPLYPSALDRLSGKSNAAPSIAAHMASREALTEYLAAHDVNADSHAVGHLLESQASQLKALGLSDLVCDYLDEHQLENGLWQPIHPRPYTALSGLLKIGSFYRIAGRQMKNCAGMVDAAIEIVLSDKDPIYVILVYNPWGGLRYALRNMRLANETAEKEGKPLPYDLNAAYGRVREAAPRMIAKTIEKLRRFQKPGGSFSYLQARSAPETQGVPVSLGLCEGDVNGTALAMNTMTATIFEVLGVPRVPLYGDEERRLLLKMLETARVAKKSERAN